MRAETIAKALGGNRRGHGWAARCPAHDDRDPSLSIRNAGSKVLVHCHAGCDQRDVIAALKSRGLWRHNHDSVPMPPMRPAPISADAARIDAAMRIWRRAGPISGTPVDAYLSSRGLAVRSMTALRFMPRLNHPSGARFPGMVALVRRGVDGEPIAVHRTFLRTEGRGKASVEPARMMLGPCRGGAVRLSEPGEVLMVGEGIETCLAAMQATGHSAWAALSTSGLRTLDLPETVREVIVLADGDDAGEAAAGNCAQRWARESRRVKIARPPRGMDFNDWLLGRAPKIEGGGQ